MIGRVSVFVERIRQRCYENMSLFKWRDCTFALCIPNLGEETPGFKGYFNAVIMPNTLTATRAF